RRSSRRLNRNQGPDVTVELDGQPATLGLSFPGDNHVKVGDHLVVVQDPNNPGYVIVANIHDDWSYSTCRGLAIFVTFSAIALVVLFGGIPERRAVRAARRARNTKILMIESVSDEGLVRLRDPDGGSWEWPADEEWRGDRTGPVLALGEMRAGGWALLY